MAGDGRTLHERMLASFGGNESAQPVVPAAEPSVQGQPMSLHERMLAKMATPTPTPTTPQNRDDILKALRDAASTKSLAESSSNIIKKAGLLTGQEGASQAMKDNVADVTAQAPMLGEPVRLPMATGQEIGKIYKENPDDYQVSNTSFLGGPEGVQLQDKTGKSLMQMRPFSSYDPSIVSHGHNLLSYLAGPASPAQHAVAQVLAAPLGLPQPDFGSGYGIDELGAAAGKADVKTGRVTPEQMIGKANLYAKIAGTAGFAPSMIDAVQAPLAHYAGRALKSLGSADYGDAMEQIAGENEQDLKKSWDEYHSLLKGAPVPTDPEELKRVGEEAGEAYGRSLGETASSASPTELGSVAIKGAKWAANTTPGKWIGSLLRKNIIESKPAEEAAKSVGALVHDQPLTALMPDEASNAILRGASTFRNAPQAEEWEVAHGVLEKLKGIASREGVTVEQLDHELGQAMPTLEGRRKAPQYVKDAIELVQPLHQEVAHKVLDAAGIARERLAPETSDLIEELARRTRLDSGPLTERALEALSDPAKYKAARKETQEAVGLLRGWAAKKKLLADVDPQFHDFVSNKIDKIARTNPFSLPVEGSALENGILRATYDPMHPYVGQAATRAGGGTTTAMTAREASLFDPPPGDIHGFGSESAAKYDRSVIPEAEYADRSSVPGFQSLEHPGTPRVNQPLDDMLRQREDMFRAQGRPEAEVKKMMEELSPTFSTGLARSAKRAMTASGVPRQRAYSVILEDVPEIRKAYPNALKEYLPDGKSPLDDLVKAGDSRIPHSVDVLGNEKPRTFPLPEDASKALTKNDEVVLRIGGRGPSVEDKLGNRIVNIESLGPELDAQFHNKRVPRLFAESLQDMTPDAEKLRVSNIAQRLDEWMGRSQMAALMTRAVPGFPQRNLFNQGIVMAIDGVDLNLARPSVKALAEGKNVMVEGKLVTPREIRSVLNVGRSSADELAGVSRMPEGPTVLNAFPRVKAAQEKAANTAIKYGGKINDVFEKAWIDGNYGTLPKGFTAEDANRTAMYIDGLRRGMSKSASAQNVATLMIDLGRSSPLERNTRAINLFLPYQLGSIKSVMSQIANHPREFSRAYDVQRAMEYYDARDKGALNTKLKQFGDETGGAVHLANPDGSVQIHQAETRGMETANILQSTFNVMQQMGYANKMASNDTSLARSGGPVVASAYELLSGKSANTGKSLIGLEQEEAKFAEFEHKDIPPLIAHYLYAQENRPELLGNNQYATMAFHIAQQTPGLGRLVQYAPVRQVGRMALGIGTSPASRSSGGRVQDLTRTLNNFWTGDRARTMDTQQRQAMTARTADTMLPDPMTTIVTKNIVRGKALPPQKRAP